jgi:hypothetical protein
MRSRIACYAEENGHEQGRPHRINPTSTG